MTNATSSKTAGGAEYKAGLSRRATLTAGFAAGAALAASAVASRSTYAADEADPHASMDHSQMDHAKMGTETGPSAVKHQALIDKALHCVNTGEVCLDHCIALLTKGDTSIKECVRTVSVLLPMCVTLAKLSALDASRLKEFAKVCRDVCADCEKECNKHKDHHAVCKACAESCAACVKECDKLGA